MRFTITFDTISEAMRAWLAISEDSDHGHCQLPELATKQDWQEIKNIMATLSEAFAAFAVKQNEYNARSSAATDAVVAAIAGVTEDIDTHNAKIQELQDSNGSVTPADQELINSLETQGDALAAKLEAVATALAALDALAPPKVPVNPQRFIATRRGVSGASFSTK